MAIKGLQKGCKYSIFTKAIFKGHYTEGFCPVPQAEAPSLSYDG